jgi:hypothetical protein
MPREVDRSSWRRWYDPFLAQARPRPEWMRQLLEQIDMILAAQPSWYSIRSIQVDGLICPMCSTSMVPDDIKRTPVICPACGKLNYVVTETIAMASHFYNEDLFY